MTSRQHTAPRKLEGIACEILGHSWVVRVKNGRLVEVCSACGAPAPKLSEED